VLNLVNEIMKLELSTFIKAMRIKTVESGSRNLFIFRHETYIIKGIFNRVNNSSKRDFVLNNVVIVEGFYINIVFKAKLLLAGI